MRYMFYYTGFRSSSFKLDCSNWNVDNVVNITDFKTSSRVTPPKWVN